ncbi:MAG: efflux RND transporter permease subunit [Candidatus Dadabacteria bacterium]|nr:MAG: efflux RND transporter permease subunit [Candidatus Dadabacteria bacterium]
MPDVGQVFDSGLENRELSVELDPKRLAALDLPLDAVRQAVAAAFVRVGAGKVQDAGHETLVMVVHEPATPDDIGGIVVRAQPGRPPLRIRDVGRVMERFPNDTEIVRFSGHDGVSLWITKRRQADVIRTIESVNQTVHDWLETAPPTVRFTSTYDASIETRTRLRILRDNAAAGFALVLLILFLFLDRRIAFWTALGIPFSIALTTVILPWTGITLNSISLCGLIIVLGMIVDDAIIVAESIYRRIESGTPLRQAVEDGLFAVIGPVTATILTTIIAFIPIWFIPGVEGKFAAEIPAIVMLMLASSLLEATTILPAHIAHAGPTADSRRPPGARWMDHLERIYRRALTVALRWRYALFAAVLAGFAALAIWGAEHVRFVMYPLDQAWEVWIYGKTADGTSLEDTAKAMAPLEHWIEQLPAGVVHSYKTVAGRDPDGWVQASNAFFAKLVLTPAQQRTTSATDVRERLLDAWKAATDTAITELSVHIESGGPPVGRPVEVRVISNDNAARNDALDWLRQRLDELGVTDIDSDAERSEPALRLQPDLARAAAAGITPAQIAATMRTAVDGTIAAWLNTPDERIPIRVRVDPERLDPRNPTRGLLLTSRFGHAVPLDSVSHSESVVEPRTIYHDNGDRTNRLRGNLDLEVTSPASMYPVIENLLAQMQERWPDVRGEIGGQARKSVEQLSRMKINLALTVVAIWVLLTVVFNSMFQPFMVILAIPFGVVGVLIVFSLSGDPLSLFALMGMLGMAGVVVNDSLIMVDLINRKEDDTEGVKVIIEGAVERLRPIVLTTATTVVGLFPTAYGLIGGADAFISPMVTSMMWGLLAGTTSVLLFIPLFYQVGLDVRRLWRRS